MHGRADPIEPALLRQRLRALPKVELHAHLLGTVQRAKHAESFWNPTGSELARGLRYGQLLPAIRQAMADAQRDAGITARLIPAIDREAPVAAAEQLLRDVLAHRSDDTLGIGIDYRENDHPPENFAAVYAQARRAGLRTTAHAGAFGLPWVSVLTAIDTLTVDRIDHPPLLARARDRGLVFTVVSTTPTTCGNTQLKRRCSPPSTHSPR